MTKKVWEVNFQYDNRSVIVHVIASDIFDAIEKAPRTKEAKENLYDHRPNTIEHRKSIIDSVKQILWIDEP